MKCAVNFVSLSQISVRWSRRNPCSGSVRFLATWVMNASVGYGVMPASDAASLRVPEQIFSNPQHPRTREFLSRMATR